MSMDARTSMEKSFNGTFCNNEKILLSGIIKELSYTV